MSSVKFVGRRVAVGIGKESTRGTSVAATFWEKQVKVDVDDKIEHLKDDSAFGVVEDASQGFLTQKWSELSLSARVKANSFGLWLLAALGTDTPALHSGETIVYDHVYSVSETNQRQSLTVATHDPVQDYRYANAMVGELDLSLEIGKYLDFSVKCEAAAGATATNTPSFTSTGESIFLPQHATFKHASNVAGLAGATAIKIKKLDLKIANNLYRDFSFGNVAPTDILNQQLAVSGTIELLFENESDWKTYMLADTARSMLLDVKNTDVTIGSAANPELQIQLDSVKFTNLSRGIDNDKVVTQKVEFNAYYSLAAARMMLVTLTNLTASY